MNYQLFFNSLGQFENAIFGGVSIPYYPLNPSHTDTANELTIAFLQAVEAGEVDISDRPPTPQPQLDSDWAGLVGNFTFPGNPLYTSIGAKVAASPWEVRDHWDNLKTVITYVQNAGALEASVHHLAGLLQAANQPLSAEDIASWNALVEQFNFPASCSL